MPQERALWSFAMYGRVRRAVVLGYEDLSQLPLTTIYAALYCAAEPQHPEHLLSGEWQGAALADLMAEAELQPGANSAVIYGADGSQLALPATALEGAVLATRLNGEALTAEQGFPARLIVPGLTACDMPRWVERIEWSAETATPPAPAQNIAVITSPPPGAFISQQVHLQGLALAADQVVSAVELSIDDGDWFAIPLHIEANHMARWSLDWTPPGAGQYGLKVRAAASVNTHQVTIIVN